MFMMHRSYILVSVLVLIVGAIWYLQSYVSHPVSDTRLQKQEIVLDGLAPLTCEAAGNCTSTNTTATTTAPSVVETKARQSAKQKQYPRALELSGIAGYINTHDGFRLSEVVGKKVVLIDFWTYSCINCQRTQPYLNAWYKKYKDAGLEIVGVHTPEFAFEKDRTNVAAAVEKFGITYPVVQDNDYQTWGAYGNRYWPRKYLVDIDGYIVYDHIGEGGYEETEEKIQELLRERSMALGQQMQPLSGTVATSVVVPTNGSEAISVETYFGSSRNEFLSNGLRGVSGKYSFVLPDVSSAVSGALYLGGTWNITPEFAETVSADSSVLFRYRARDVFVVAESDGPVSLTVLRDGVPVGSFAGADVGSGGNVVIRASQLYHIIKESDYSTHTLELRINSPGVRLYTFTFG
ncbi:MAG: hypothetical protein RIQ54_354 [Candidatus Parcubacteria bacterium]|jgi:thiol-disulfide isomerase/thioredoxin